MAGQPESRFPCLNSSALRPLCRISQQIPSCPLRQNWKFCAHWGSQFDSASLLPTRRPNAPGRTTGRENQRHHIQQATPTQNKGLASKTSNTKTVNTTEKFTPWPRIATSKSSSIPHGAAGVESGGGEGGVVASGGPTGSSTKPNTVKGACSMPAEEKARNRRAAPPGHR